MSQEKAVKKFESKKHSAYLVNEGGAEIVKKVFNNPDSMAAEEKLLNFLAGRGAPKLIKTTEGALYTEYISGPDLVDLLFAAEEEACAYLGKALAEFIKEFFNLTGGLILADENLHHYILNSERGLVRVDLEEYKEGGIKEWVSKLCAFSLLYNGIKRENADAFLNALIKEAGFNFEELKEIINAERNVILERRKKS